MRPFKLGETDSLRFANESISQLWSWSTIADPGNPSLYYTLLHGWLAFGDGEGTVRLLSALFGALTIPLVYAVGRTIRDHSLGLVAALLFAISPFQLWYSREARGYALLTFGATLAMLGIAYLLRYPERSAIGLWGDFRAWRARGSGVISNRASSQGAGWAWLAYVLGTTIALLAHNTAVFLLMGANLLMLGWWLVHGRTVRFLRNWLVAQAIVLLLWGTWLPAYMQQALHGAAYSWIPRPTVRRVLFDSYNVWAGSVWAIPPLAEAPLIVFLACLGLWSWRKDRRWIAFVLILGLVAPVAELVISVSWKPIFLDKTLIWAAVPLCLAVAAGLLALRPRALAIGTLVVLVGMAGLGLRSYYLHHVEDWDQVAAFVEQGLRPGDAIYFVADYVQEPFDYYYTSPPYSVDEVGIPVGRGDLPTIFEEAKQYPRIWLVVSHSKGPEDLAIGALGGAGFHRTGPTRFAGVEVYLFDIDG